MNLFDIPKLEQDLKTLESKTLEDGFWNDSKKSGKVLQEIKVIKNNNGRGDDRMKRKNNILKKLRKKLND